MAAEKENNIIFDFIWGNTYGLFAEGYHLMIKGGGDLFLTWSVDMKYGEVPLDNAKVEEFMKDLKALRLYSWNGRAYSDSVFENADTWRIETNHIALILESKGANDYPPEWKQFLEYLHVKWSVPVSSRELPPEERKEILRQRQEQEQKAEAKQERNEKREGKKKPAGSTQSEGSRSSRENNRDRREGRTGSKEKQGGGNRKKDQQTRPSKDNDHPKDNSRQKENDHPKDNSRQRENDHPKDNSRLRDNNHQKDRDRQKTRSRQSFDAENEDQPMKESMKKGGEKQKKFRYYRKKTTGDKKPRE